MGLASIFLYTTILLNISPTSFAYTLDGSCTGNTATTVKAATDQMISIARYTVGRARDSDPQHRRGTLLQDLVGAPDENDAGTLDWLRGVVGKVGAKALDDSTRIYCNDAHLIPINARTGYFRDPTINPPSQVFAPRRPNQPPVSNTACGGINNAFTYETSQGARIVLCSDSAVSSLQNLGQYWNPDQFRDAGDLMQMAATNNRGMDIFAATLSYVIFHEMVHASDMRGFPAQLPDPGLNNQPVTELYRYAGITGQQIGTAPTGAAPSVNNRRHNADSIALVACAWYQPIYGYRHGVLGSLTLARRGPLHYESRDDDFSARRLARVKRVERFQNYRLGR